MNAQEIKNEMDRQAASRANQINVEFEGFDPGHEMPQDRKIAELQKQLHASGNIFIDGGMYSAEEIQSKREHLNSLVRAFAAENPNQGIPVAKLKEFESKVGLSLSSIKCAVSTLGL